MRLILKYLSVTWCFLLCSFFSYSQLVFNGGAKIRFNGGTSVNNIFMVLNSPPTNPIISASANDGIIMEAEFNRLQYNLSTGTTSIVVPYMSTALEKIPLTLTVSAAGTGAGNIRFSSIVAATRATGYDNNNYRPSDVTNMSALPSVANNSAKTIDRFWIIDANGYTTRPAVNLAFTYIDAEHAANGGNTITEANLRAQRFNSTVNDWGGYVEYLPTGTINTGGNTVSNVVVSAANFFKSWTLNDNSVPLPVELLNFDATCFDNNIILEWCTASEKNNQYFTIEYSTDGVNFVELTTVQGNGTTQDKHCYSFKTDIATANVNYFRLKQTDFDNTTTIYKTISTEACSPNTESTILAHDGSKDLGLIINSSADIKYDLSVHNSLGQIIDTQIIDVKKGANNITVHLNNVSNGVYFVNIMNGNISVVSKKIIISDVIKN